MDPPRSCQFSLTLATSSVEGFDIFAAHHPPHFAALTVRDLSSFHIAPRFNDLRSNPLIVNLFPPMAARLHFPHARSVRPASTECAAWQISFRRLESVSILPERDPGCNRLDPSGDFRWRTWVSSSRGLGIRLGMSCLTFLRRLRSVRKELLLIALLITVGHTDFAAAQSLASASEQKSSPLDLKGLTKKADSGSTESQFQLGLAYQLGKGVNKDIAEAIKWYRVAANHGDPAAQNNLGYIYQTGPKAVRDLTEASRWYMRAASDGNPAAQVNLGLLYLRGEGVKKSPGDALHWINRAAETEYPTAMAALACLYATHPNAPSYLAKPV